MWPLRYPLRGLAVLLVLAAGAAVAGPPPTDDSEAPRAEEVALLRERARVALWSDRASARPPYRPRPVVPAGLTSPPGQPPQRYGAVKTVTTGAQSLRLAFADGALPLRYEVDRELAGRFGLDVIVEGMSAWNGIAGSRWETLLTGLSRRPLDEAYADGVSTVYLRKLCRPGLLGSVRWQLAPSVAVWEVRNGTGAVFTSEVDIAVCPNADTPERVWMTLIHEVGHVLGQAHLCERAQPCPGPLDDVDPACRVMHWRLNTCGAQLREGDLDMARHLYPTLGRVWGPTAADTAARASYASTDTHGARHVVLARPGTHPWLLAPTVVEHAADDAPLLLGEPDLRSCVRAPAGTELTRVAGPGALVTLVGPWPPVCEAVLHAWGLRVQRRAPTPAGRFWTGAERMAVQLAAADRIGDAVARDGAPSTELVIAPLPGGLHGGQVDGGEAALVWSAAALAAARRAPLLLLSGHRLPGAVAAWLDERPNLRVVHAVGGTEVLSPVLLHDLRRAGLATRRWGGVSPVNVTAGALDALPAQAPVLLAAEGDPAGQAVAAALAVRTGGGFVVAGTDTRPAGLLRRLEAREPRGGVLVAAPDQVGYPAQWALAVRITAGEDPRLHPAWRPEPVRTWTAPFGVWRNPSQVRVEQTFTDGSRGD